MTNEELIHKVTENVYNLTTFPFDETIIKDVVCKFYQKGKCPDCLGCEQPLATMEECRDDYVRKIGANPMEVWEAVFDKMRIREKTPVKEVIELGLNCNRCYMSEKCPVYKLDHLCGIDWGEKVTSPKEMIEGLMEIQYTRINRASKIEQMDGGVPDQTLSMEMDRMQVLISTRNDFDINRFDIHMSGQVQGGEKPVGILQQLFGGGNKEVAEPKEVKMVDAPADSYIEIQSPEIVIPEAIKGPVGEEAIQPKRRARRETPKD